MISLRHYQEDAVASLFAYFEENDGNPLIALPTGTGKSIVIAEFLRRVFSLYRGQRIIVATHVKELVKQNFDELLALWPQAPAGIYSAGLKRREIRSITFVGIASVAKRADEFGSVDLLLIDEAHRMSPNEDSNYQKFISELKVSNPSLKVIGLSATPFRLGQGLLTEPLANGKPSLFTDICCDWCDLERFNQLVEEGFLAPLIPKRTQSEIDVSEVHVVGGEFNAKELEAAADKEAITKAAVEEMVELGSDRNHWLVFGSGIDHCLHIVDELDRHGIPAAAVHSKSGAVRDSHIADFKAGKLGCLVNNNVLTTGFNFKPIDLIGVLRPTMSPGLWVQMLGRGTRPAEGKENCLVLDFAGNTRRLGPINDPVIPRRKGQGGGVPPVKLCEHCGTYNHASVRVCVGCGQPFPLGPVKLVTQASNAELIVTKKEPVLKSVKVGHVSYAKHRKLDRPDSIRISYRCGLSTFSEFLCLEHEGFASRKARELWRQRSGKEPPSTTEAALQLVETLRKPTDILVRIDTKYPEILKVRFDGIPFEIKPV